MSTQQDDRVLVVVQMTGGNDFLNTVVPFTNEHYFDARKKIRINPDEVLPINDELGINQNAAPFKRLYDEGKMAIVQGVGYPNSNRSHFRGMDIWHTCEPDKVGLEGWLGQAIRELDPHAENVLTVSTSGAVYPGHGSLRRSRHLRGRPGRLRRDDRGRAGRLARPRRLHVPQHLRRRDWRRPNG